jgi:flagellin
VGSQAHVTLAISINSAPSDDFGSARYMMAGSNLAGSANTTLGSASAATTHQFAATEVLTIDGINTGQVSIAPDDSAADVAAKMGSIFNTTGVNADAKTIARLEGFADANSGDGISFDLGNGTLSETVSFTATGVVEDDLQTLVNKVNESSAVTGIGAKYDAATTSVILTSEAGDNIVVDNFADSGATGTPATLNLQGRSYGDDQDVGAAVTLDAAATTTDQGSVKGQLQLDSTVLFSVASDQANSDLTGIAAAGVSAQAIEESIEFVDVTTAIGAQDAIAVIDGALAKIDRNRATLGAVQNRLQSTIRNLANIVENSSGARARIRDTDFAKETAELTRNQILQQAGTSILAQANQLPQAALSLLGQ